MRSSSAYKLLLLLHKAPVLMGNEFHLPYSIDFSALPNGALPDVFYAPNWTISGGKAICIPTLSNELVVNGNFAAWTGDNPDGWAISGAPELAGDYVTEATGACRIVRTTKAIGINQVCISPSTVYRVSREVTVLVSGSALMTQGGLSDMIGKYGTLNAVAVKTDDAWLTSTAVALRIYSNTNGSDITFDNVSVKQLTGLFALLPISGKADVTVKGNLTLDTDGLAGVVVRADSRSNPTNYVIAWMRKSMLTLTKVVNGVRTDLPGNVDPSYGASRLLELRVVGTSYEVWYNNVKKINATTINEPTINNNTIHGAWSTNGGNSLDSFFCILPA